MSFRDAVESLEAMMVHSPEHRENAPDETCPKCILAFIISLPIQDGICSECGQAVDTAVGPEPPKDLLEKFRKGAK